MADKNESISAETVDIEEYAFDAIWGETPSEEATTDASVKAQLADGLAVGPGSEIERMLALQLREEGAQQAFADALEHGRRIEELLPDGLVKFTEYIPRPGGDPGDVLIRHGMETPKLDGSIEVYTTHIDPKDPSKILTITSERRDGVERVLKVTGALPGGNDLKPGDIFPVADPAKTAAGLAPSTLDPKTDGSAGNARPPSTTQGSSEPTGSSSTSSTGSSPATGGRPTGDGTPDAGPTSGGNEPSAGTEPVTSEKTDRTWDSHTPATEGGKGDSGVDTTSHTDEYKNSDGTYRYETTTTTTDTATGKSETTTTSETTSTQKQYVAADGYSDPGLLPPAEQGVSKVAETTSDGQATTTVSSDKIGTGAGSLMHTREGNPHTVSGDYGNPLDENDAAPPKDEPGPDPVDPLIHVDPELEGEATIVSIEQHELQASIHGGDFVNPNDPLFGENAAPSGTNPNDTSPYEHTTGDDDLP